MEEKEKYILAIDLGTSGPKSALVSTSGDVLGYEFEEVPIKLYDHGGAEQSPDDWWNTIMSTSKKMLSKKLVPTDDIIAIACTSQWSGTVAVDRNGNHLMDSIIWLDSRGSKHAAEARRGLINFEGFGLSKLITWIRLTGGAPSPSGKDPFGHILYIKNEHPDIYEKTYKFLEPKDYINLRLTGRYAASHDSITLHWITDNRNISKVDYNTKLLKMAQVERDKFPDLKRAIDVLGPIKKEVADELGLRGDVQVILGTPDLMSASVGSGAVRDYEGHVYIGTSSWVCSHVPFKKTDVLHSIGSVPSAKPDRYLTICEQETAGQCLNYLRDNILYHKDELLQEEEVPDVYKIFDRLVESVPAGSNNLIFTPWLYGERTPVEDHTVRAGLFNQSLDTTRAHIIRAVFEGVAYNTRWLLQYVEKFNTRKFEHLNMIGGGANSNIWCQIYADVLNRKIRQIKDPIMANARGAAFLAAIGLGYLTFDQIPDKIQILNEYEPNPDNRKVYDNLFREFMNIYKMNKKIYQRLNG